MVNYPEINVFLKSRSEVLGVWGDDIELEAFRRAYGRAIVIYDASTGTPYVKPYNGDEGTSLNTVHLWKSECHYESVRNRDGPFDGPSRVMYKVGPMVYGSDRRMSKCRLRKWRRLRDNMKMLLWKN